MNELIVKYCKIDIDAIKREDEIKKIIPKTFAIVCKYKSEIMKCQTLLSKLMVIKNLNCDENDIYYNKLRKPYVKGKQFFNISHSKDYIVYVESKSEVGIDIEYISEKNFSILNYAFTDEERDFILKNNFANVDLQYSTLKRGRSQQTQFQLDSCERKARFIYLWTIKESLFKASGNEIYEKPNKIIVEEIDDKISKNKIEGCEKDEKYNLGQLKYLFDNLNHIEINQKYLGVDYHIYSFKFMNYIVSIASKDKYDEISLEECNVI